MEDCVIMETCTLVKLPDSELEIMQAIWALDLIGEKYITASLIMENYPEIGRLKLTTVLTLMTRLQTKGFICINKIGRTNCCKPLISRLNYQKYVTNDFIYRVFLGEKENLINIINN